MADDNPIIEPRIGPPTPKAEREPCGTDAFREAHMAYLKARAAHLDYSTDVKPEPEQTALCKAFWAATHNVLTTPAGATYQLLQKIALFEEELIDNRVAGETSDAREVLYMASIKADVVVLMDSLCPRCGE